MIRILITDGHPIVREGLCAILHGEPDIAIVGQAQDGVEALELLATTDPDVILLELRMPRLEGLAVLRTLAVRPHRAKVLLFTGSEDREAFVEAMKLGCAGILMKTSEPGLIAKSIRKVHEGEIWLDANTTTALIRQFATPAEARAVPAEDTEVTRDHPQLSHREREVIVLIAQGHKNKEISEKMFITEQTVKNHLHNVFDKLGVSDRLQLALYAIHNNLHVNASQPEQAAGR